MSEQDILQRRLAKFLVGEAFHTISEEDILKNVNGKWYHKGNELTEADIKLIQKEATNIVKTRTYAILINEVRYYARQSLEKAETETDIINAKLLSYFCDVMNSKLKKLVEL